MTKNIRRNDRHTVKVLLLVIKHTAAGDDARVRVDGESDVCNNHRPSNRVLLYICRRMTNKQTPTAQHFIRESGLTLAAYSEHITPDRLILTKFSCEHGRLKLWWSLIGYIDLDLEVQ